MLLLPAAAQLPARCCPLKSRSSAGNDPPRPPRAVLAGATLETMPTYRPAGLLHTLLLGLLLGHGTSRLPSSAEEELATDLEAPGVLAGAALRLATAHNEVVFVVTGPDATSMRMANNSLVTLAGVGLRGHTMMMADSFATCQKMGGPMRRQCYWSSRVLQNRPSESIVNSKVRVRVNPLGSGLGLGSTP